MAFCDRGVVDAMLRGKTVALVGSGPGALGNDPRVVDSHDVVVRCNNYKLFPATGYRTDIFYSFFGKSIRKTADELTRDGVKLCLCKCPNERFIESEWHQRHGKINGIDFRYIYEYRADWWFCDTYVPTLAEFLRHFQLLDQHVPTTGFAALLDILSFEPKHVFMTGFDFFQSGVHNVDERWKPGNPEDPIGHDPAAEHRWFMANAPRLPITTDAALSAVLAQEWAAPPVRPRLVRSHRRVR